MKSRDRENAVLIIRAHGIAPDERKKIKESGVKIIDATCPKVGYVQAIIKKHTALDYTVIIVGDREHPEVDGLWGYTEGRGIIVSTLEGCGKITRHGEGLYCGPNHSGYGSLPPYCSKNSREKPAGCCFQYDLFLHGKKAGGNYRPG